MELQDQPDLFELISSPITEENGPGRDYEPPGPILSIDEARWEMSGLERPLRNDVREALPTLVIDHAPVPSVFDFQTTHFLPLVSPRFRDLLESLDPNTHEFIEIELKLSNFPDVEMPPHYFLNISKVSNGLDFDRCPKKTSPPTPISQEMQDKYGVRTMPARHRLYLTPGRGRVFNEDAIRNRNLFGVFNELCAWTPTFVSPKLKQAFEEWGLKGLDVVPCRPD
ncbi:MAG: hypothetical protein K0U74_02670 [Alphaproteobacteria bacterium]|nr:hypothetical protein [Alphaproteobacteria bacterium]